MTWSYSGDPTTSPTDEIRFLLQDTNTSDQLLQNEEIQFFSDKMDLVTGSRTMTAAYLADILAARYAREVAISADGVNVQAEALQDKFTSMAASLRAMAGIVDMAGVGPSVGGTGDPLDDCSPSLPPKTFTSEMHDNRWAGSQTPGSWPDFSYSDEPRI